MNKVLMDTWLLLKYEGAEIKYQMIDVNTNIDMSYKNLCVYDLSVILRMEFEKLS